MTTLVSSVVSGYLDRVKEKRVKVAELSEVEKKFQEIQLLKFGQTIDLDLLERSGTEK